MYSYIIILTNHSLSPEPEPHSQHFFSERSSCSAPVPQFRYHFFLPSAMFYHHCCCFKPPSLTYASYTSHTSHTHMYIYIHAYIVTCYEYKNIIRHIHICNNHQPSCNTSHGQPVWSFQASTSWRWSPQWIAADPTHFLGLRVTLKRDFYWGNDDLVGGFNPSEKISQWEGLSHILWKIKNVPNHQPVIHWGKTWNGERLERC